MTANLKGVAWSTLGNWAQQFTTFMTMLLLARLLVPADFGLTALAALFPLVIQRILLESVSYAVVRRQQIDSSFLDSAFCASMIGAVVLTSALLLGRFELSQLFGEPRLANVLVGFAIQPLIEGAVAVQTGLLRRERRFDTLARRTILGALIGAVVGVVLALFGAGVWSLILQQVTGSLVSLFVLWRHCDWRPGKAINGSRLIELAHFGGPLMGNALVFVFVNRVDVVFVAWSSTAAALGFYGMAKRIIRMIIDIFASGIQQTSMTILAELQTDLPAFVSTQGRLLRWTTLLVFPIFAYLATASASVVEILLGSVWSETGYIISILAFYGFAQVVNVIQINALIALGRTQVVFLVNFGGAILLTLLLFARADVQIVDVALAMAAQAIAVTITLAAFSHSGGVLPASDFLRALAPATLLNAGTSVVAVLVLWHTDNLPHWVRAAAASVPWLTIYSPCVLWATRRDWGAIIRTLRYRRSSKKLD